MAIVAVIDSCQFSMLLSANQRLLNRARDAPVSAGYGELLGKSDLQPWQLGDFCWGNAIYNRNRP